MWQTINRRFPISVFLIAAYPAVSLLAANYQQTEPLNILRPLIFSWLIAAAVYFALLKIFKDQEKAGVISTIFVFILLGYGRAFISLSLDLDWTRPLGNFNHLIVSLGAAALMWLFIRIFDQTKLLESATMAVFSAALLLMPSYQIARNVFRDPYLYTPEQIEIPDSFYQEPMPDVYHIVLDAYAREDQLARMGFDNAEFIGTLREQGFYVADCVRSNYSRTALSLTSTLNLNYLSQLFPNETSVSRNDAALYAALSNNLVQFTFDHAGYTFITNKNGYVWSEMPEHADIFIAPKGNRLFAPYLLPFEKLFLENSAFRIMLDLEFLKTYRDGYLLNGQHYEQVTTALDALTEIPNIPGPKYTYFHLIVPHSPNIFNPDGSLAPGLVNPEGYLRNVEYLNNTLPPILAEIIEESETPPIIIIQGDHGYAKDKLHRYDILNAIYFPAGHDQLYPTISPMNTYRLIFSQLFGQNIPQLEEISIQGDIGHPFGQRPAELPALPDYCP